MEKLVSVCINCYNSENTILNTVNSVLNQTYKNLQVIIVDDCSTDNSVEALKTIVDPRVEIHVLEENVGVSRSNNETFKYVKGDYVAHLDSDDIWVPEKIEKQVNFLENNKDYGACFSYSGTIDEHGKITNEGRLEGDTVYNYKNRSSAEYVHLCFYEMNHFNHSSLVIRKEVLDKLGLHNPTFKFLHDFDLWTRLILLSPIYVFEEPLVYCLVRENSLSAIDSVGLMAHTEELTRINYKLINNCPDEMFLTAFKDKLMFVGTHTHEEVELEKAFLLANCIYALNNNTLLMQKKLDELLAEEKYIKIAKEKFNFSLADLHKMHTEPSFYNRDEINHYNNLLAIKENEKAELNKALAVLYDRYPSTVDKLPSVIIYQKLRGLKSGIKEVLKVFSKRMKNGKRAKSVYTVYGYLSHNVGDDLFFDTLFKRYPDTLFKIAAPDDCFEFFSKYDNVRYFDWSRKLVAKINNIGTKFNKENAFERLLIKTSNGAIHIGGSIYQQVGDWQNDLKIRKYRLGKNREYYSISSNFGPYTTSEYFDFWKNFFCGSTDVCFRDRYSYELFKDVKSVRYCPDLLFGFKYDGEIKTEKRIAISVIDAFLTARNLPTEICKNYENLLINIAKKYCDLGYVIDLLCFCKPEGDENAADRIIKTLPNKNINKIVYDGTDFEPILKSVATSEIVVASRFHAMVLGYVFEKKVLNITYSKKTDNVLFDLALDCEPLTLNNLGNDKAVFEKLSALVPSDISLIKEQAQGQFSTLDGKILKRHGRVNK